jgi:catechol 2,3-dioxygenase-like lactoylglutathione lyase family enzyme
MKIKLESIYVSDLDQALAFYTEVLGFAKKKDTPIGNSRYLTVVSPDEPNGTELLLEPNGEHPATKAYKKAIYEEGIPLAAFLVEDIIAEHARLQSLDVVFKTDPERFGKETIAVFDDTCGNLIMIYQTHTE